MTKVEKQLILARAALEFAAEQLAVVNPTSTEYSDGTPADFKLANDVYDKIVHGRSRMTSQLGRKRLEASYKLTSMMYRYIWHAVEYEGAAEPKA